jgi:hypothetical protein
MTLTLPEPQPGDEFAGKTDRQLQRRRDDLMRELCPSCDRGLANQPCSCHDGVAEAERIEAELERRRDAKEE